MLLVCISYVLVCCSYVPVCTRMLLVCYSYVLVCYSYVLVWCFSHDRSMLQNLHYHTFSNNTTLESAVCTYALTQVTYYCEKYCLYYIKFFFGLLTYTVFIEYTANSKKVAPRKSKIQITKYKIQEKVCHITHMSGV